MLILKSRSRKYCDVLYTNNLVIGRQGPEDGPEPPKRREIAAFRARFRRLKPHEQVSVSLIAAAAPNIKFSKDATGPRWSSHSVLQHVIWALELSGLSERGC